MAQQRIVGMVEGDMLWREGQLLGDTHHGAGLGLQRWPSSKPGLVKFSGPSTVVETSGWRGWKGRGELGAGGVPQVNMRRWRVLPVTAARDGILQYHARFSDYSNAAKARLPRSVLGRSQQKNLSVQGQGPTAKGYTGK